MNCLSTSPLALVMSILLSACGNPTSVSQNQPSAPAKPQGTPAPTAAEPGAAEHGEAAHADGASHGDGGKSYFMVSTPLGEIPGEDPGSQSRPPVVTLDERGVPSDAVILFDGTDLSAWEHPDKLGMNEPVSWDVVDGAFSTKPDTIGIATKQDFGDVQLHIEWRNPVAAEGELQGHGNSGVFFANNLYEIQVHDMARFQLLPLSQTAALYHQHAPLVTALKPTGEWHTYDIVYRMPHFDDAGQKTESGSLTVFHNGVLVHDKVEILGKTNHEGPPTTVPHGRGRIFLQEHDDRVEFRNIWARHLD